MKEVLGLLRFAFNLLAISVIACIVLGILAHHQEQHSPSPPPKHIQDALDRATQ
jgi:hypothetical protein